MQHNTIIVAITNE